MSGPVYTNCNHWFEEFGLDSTKHELWWIEMPEANVNIQSSKTQIICSIEGKSISYASPNTILFDSLISDNLSVNPFMFHWWRIVDTNRNLDVNSFSKDTPLLFDALLGLERPHRNFAWDWFRKNPDISKKGYITYYRYTGNKDEYHVDDDVSTALFRRSSLAVDYHGMNVPYSSIIPKKIYNQTRVTVVCETRWCGSGSSHFTEKIAKPLFCKRPFIVLSNAGYLRRLRTFGFQTFGDIIDESYDEIDDDLTRWKRALEQLYKFQSLTWTNVETSLSERLDHNRSIIETDWMDAFKQKCIDLK